MTARYSRRIRSSHLLQGSRITVYYIIVHYIVYYILLRGSCVLLVV